METLFAAIRAHYAERNTSDARYHRHMVRSHIKQVRACYPKPAQARPQAIYLDQCKRRAMLVLGL